jgi:hypothetical protein
MNYNMETRPKSLIHMCDPEKDYYEVLGVGREASQEEIDRVFRERARQYHPDRGGSEEEMKMLNEAHDLLGDPLLRRAYDNHRDGLKIPRGSSAAYEPGPASDALKIPVADGDFVGLSLGAAACIALGLPFLTLVEMQWVFFLWPLRILTLGVLVVGVLMAHSALKVKHRRGDHSHVVRVVHEVVFWGIVAVGAIAVYMLFYSKSIGWI